MNRDLQNRALKDLQELCADLSDLEKDLRVVLIRGRFEPAPWLAPWKADDPMKGTPPPHYGDPAGEAAMAGDQPIDEISKVVIALANDLSRCRTTAKRLRDLASTDVVARAERTMPDCLACGDQCIDRVYSGFDQKCYRRWVRAHRPDRSKFMAAVKAERPSLDEVNDDGS